MNRILFADDCLDVLRDEVALPGQSVDLIYLDPPFNSNSRYNLPFRGKYKTGSLPPFIERHLRIRTPWGFGAESPYHSTLSCYIPLFPRSGTAIARFILERLSSG